MITFHLNKWASGQIRGVQIVEQLHKLGIQARCSDGGVDPRDINIFIKVIPPVFEPVESGAVYVDVVDSVGLVPYIQQHPNWNVIAISRIEALMLSSLVRNNIVLIPEHSCNFENILRSERPVKVVGYCGEAECFCASFDGVKECLAREGLDFVWKTSFSSRLDVAEFYKGIDIQLMWRPDNSTNWQFKNPLKVTNAGSFRIPTVSWPEPCMVDEYGGCFMPAWTVEDAIGQCIELSRDPVLYNIMSDAALSKSADYHISQIVDLYADLAVSTISKYETDENAGENNGY